ncbi:geranylgeranylglyceryl/heptaprenylglyceryl phosphate synthase [Flavobacteriales bacterium]|nr:geranylgeranylglyceryl/heptaprenylglyceryl phosphate synthase [Flavobacteriales bacterium]
MRIYNHIIESKRKGRKLFSILIDPDKQTKESLLQIIEKAKSANVDFFFIGGSLLTNNSLDFCITIIKQNCKIPVLLFPGNAMQVNNKTDGILFLSLISGRNAELLIGNHVIAAPFLKESDIEILSTGYMLIDSGKATTVSYMSNTTPIPHDKDDIAVCTAIAGEMLGLKMIYMDGGSGAKNSVSEKMITSVSNNIDVPLIVGGGINTAEKAKEKCRAGSDIIVVGNAIEKENELIQKIATAICSVK